MHILNGKHNREVVTNLGCVCVEVMSKCRGQYFVLVTSQQSIEEVRGMCALCTSFKRLLLNNQDKNYAFAGDLSYMHKPGFAQPFLCVSSCKRGSLILVHQHPVMVDISATQK